MEKISYNLVFNRKKNLNKRGMALIQVEAYLNKKKMYLSTKIYIKPNQWDDKRKMVKNHPNADILNCMLYEYISTIEQTELGLWQQGKEISLSLLKNLLKKPVSNEKSFLDFYKEELATFFERKYQAQSSFHPRVTSSVQERDLLYRPHI